MLVSGQVAFAVDTHRTSSEDSGLLPTCPGKFLPNRFASFGAGELQPGYIRHFGPFSPCPQNHTANQLSTSFCKTNFIRSLLTTELEILPNRFQYAGLMQMLFPRSHRVSVGVFCPLAVGCMPPRRANRQKLDPAYEPPKEVAAAAASRRKSQVHTRSSVSSSHPHSCLERYWSPTSHSAFCRYFES